MQSHFFILLNAHALDDLLLARVHPVAVQRVGAARLHLVRARTVQRHHEQVAVRQRVDGLHEHGRRDIEAGIVLVELGERHGNDRDVA